MAFNLRSTPRGFLMSGLAALLLLATLLLFVVNPQVRPCPAVIIQQAQVHNVVITDAPQPSKNRYWKRTNDLAEQCISLHSLSMDSWQNLNSTTLHIVYFTWLPENGNAQKIIPEQLDEVEKSGLFDRPRTKLHVILSTQDRTQREWFTSLDVIQKYRPILIPTERNTFEFAGIRYLYELGCQNPSDLFLYFHSKGSRYNRGRIGMEIVLTREIVVNWKNMLTLIAEHPTFHTFGLGGPGYQWMNFYYARGSLFPLVPKPLVVTNRYWYEEWCGNDLTPVDPSKSPTSNSQCSTITGMEKALQEPIAHEPTPPRRKPQYGILRCGSASVNSPQLDAWSIPADKEAEQAYQKEIQSRQNTTRPT